MFSRVILAFSLILMLGHATAAYYVNETVGEFRISFEGLDDTNLIMKGWDQTKPGGMLEDMSTKLPEEVNSSFVVMAGKPGNNSNIWSGVFVLVLNEPVQTSVVGKGLFNDSSKSYMRIYNRTIDGYEGIYSLQGDGPNDPSMDHLAFYWLDETGDGMATELVSVMSNEAENVAQNVMNTVHVEKIN